MALLLLFLFCSLATLSTSIELPKSCPEKQKALLGFAGIVLNEVETFGACAEECWGPGGKASRQNYSCNSLMFFPGFSQCILNKEDKTSQPDSFAPPETDVEVIYADRNACIGTGIEWAEPLVGRNLFVAKLPWRRREGAKWRRKAESLDECQAECERRNRRKKGKLSQSCETVVFNAERGDCYFYDIKPINLCASWTTLSPAFVTAHLLSDFPSNRFVCH